MKKITKRIQVSILLVLMITGVSCEKIVEVSSPSDRIISAEVFSNDATATAALLGLYQDMTGLNGSVGNFGLSLYPGLSAGEISRSSSVAAYDEFSNNALVSNNSLLGTYIWNKAYNLIFQANSIIAGLQDNPSVSVAVKNQLLGEARFIRAFYHFYLLNLFGPVPLVTSIDYKQSSFIARTSQAELYTQIISDLTEAKGLLQASYPSAGRVRINKWAATALLSRIFLYQGKWAEAASEADEVVSSGEYALVQNLNSVFLAGSREAIFQLLPTGAVTTSIVNTWDGNNFIPASGSVPQYRLNPSLFNIFSATDLRGSNWINSAIIAGTTYYYPYKYKVKTGSSITEYYMFIRYAEVILNRAEAMAHQGKLAPAIKDLDLIRSRAGLQGLAVLNPNIAPEELIENIIQERQREFFCEMGHRWLDLKRTGKLDMVMKQTKPSWISTYSLYPIPFNEIARNPLLTQNTGYN